MIPFFFKRSGDHRDLHSFPTRRSSDLLFVDALLDVVRNEDRDDLGVDRRLRDRADDEQVIAILVDRKSTRLNSSHVENSYAVFCLKKKNTVARRVVNTSSLGTVDP